MSLSEEVAELASQVPAVILKDVEKRISDWLASGGPPEAPYIQNQIHFMKNYIRLYGPINKGE